MTAVWCAVLWIAAAAPAARPEQDVLVVTSVAPVDGQRLADALRAYLGDYGIDVRTAPAAAPGDLRRELADTRRAGDDVRALAAIRVVGGAPGTVEIQVVDRVTQKALMASIPRPARDEDLYRVVALKVQALLRSTLAEAPDLLEGRPQLARLTAGSPGPEGKAVGAGDAVTAVPAAASAPGRSLSLAAGYVLASFPRGGLVQQGVSLSAAYRFSPLRVSPISGLGARIEVGLEVAALGAWRGTSGDVAVSADDLPIGISAGLRWSGRRVEALLGVTGRLVFFSISSDGPGAARNASREVVPGLGAMGEARWRLGPDVGLYARAALVGVLVGDRYLVKGVEVIDTSGLQLQASAGFSAAIW
jgi:hypothetical protein